VQAGTAQVAGAVGVMALGAAGFVDAASGGLLGREAEFRIRLARLGIARGQRE